MRQIEFVPGTQSSILGFGCAPVLGAIGAKQAERALGVALDCGITHFDVARSYGYGEAEGFLGRFLAGRRDQVVIASKFGIRATWKASLLRPLKPLVRALKDARGTNPAAGAAATTPSPTTPPPARSDPFHQRVPLDAATMRTSLERSLRALKTDHLDLFLVHEPTGELNRIDELAELAAALKREGKIRAWGLAFDWQRHPLLKPVLNRFDVLQFDNSPGISHYPEALDAYRSKKNIFFSALRGGGDLPPAEVLNRIWSDFPNSVVLCSMFNPEHIKSNAAAADAHSGENSPHA